MRRKWYLGFAVCLVLVLHFVIFIHDWRLFTLIAAGLIGLGIYDITQKKHSILRNFPILGHIRYTLEFIRPEIRQYFIAGDKEETL